MNVLITGGAGFVGAHLTRRLLERGHRVTSLDLRPGPEDESLRQAGARMLQGSVADREAVDRATAGADIVFHLASPFGDPLAPAKAFEETEVVGTDVVLAAARRHGVRRVVHCSTQGVHGIVTTPVGDEDSPIAPRDGYCEAKARGEEVAQAAIAQGQDVVIVRPTSVYGPGDTRGWLSLFRMVQKGRFVMIGSGETMNHPVYVENLVDLFELAATTPEARGRTYLAGDAEAVTLNQLVRAVSRAVGSKVRILRFPSYHVAWLGAAVVEFACRAVGVRPFVFRRRLSWFRTHRIWSIDRARRELDYTPRIGLTEGLARTAAWYRAEGLLPTGTSTASAEAPRASVRASSAVAETRKRVNARR